MEELQLIYEPFPSDALTRFLSDNVINVNFARTGVPTWHPVGFFLRNRRGEWLGGLTGHLWGGWMHVNFLWVTEALRGQRHGTRLMDAGVVRHRAWLHRCNAGDAEFPGAGLLRQTGLRSIRYAGGLSSRPHQAVPSQEPGAILDLRRGVASVIVRSHPQQQKGGDPVSHCLMSAPFAATWIPAARAFVAG